LKLVIIPCLPHPPVTRSTLRFFRGSIASQRLLTFISVVSAVMTGAAFASIDAKFGSISAVVTALFTADATVVRPLLSTLGFPLRRRMTRQQVRKPMTQRPRCLKKLALMAREGWRVGFLEGYTRRHLAGTGLGLWDCCIRSYRSVVACAQNLGDISGIFNGPEIPRLDIWKPIRSSSRLQAMRSGDIRSHS